MFHSLRLPLINFNFSLRIDIPEHSTFMFHYCSSTNLWHTFISLQQFSIWNGYDPQFNFFSLKINRQWSDSSLSKLHCLWFGHIQYHASKVKNMSIRRMTDPFNIDHINLLSCKGRLIYFSFVINNTTNNTFHEKAFTLII